MSEISSEIKKIAFKSVDEVLDFAIKGEENAKKFYSAWAKKVEKKAMKAVFEELADEEAKHKEFLLGIKEGKTTRLKPSEKEVTDLKISDYMLDVKASEDMDYQDALTVAMHREKMAYKLYSSMVKMTEDKNMQDTFRALAQEEAKHKLRLELIYDDEIMQEN
jgi:rubrerythrin